MKFARLLLLFAAFQLEIRVRAGADALWEPSGCAKSKTECHVQAGADALKVKIGEGQLDAAPGSILERKTGEWKVMTGSARVHDAAVATIYGKLEKNEGEAWIVAEAADRVVVRAVEGSAHFRGRDGKVLEIPEGLELWIGSLDMNGESSHGVPAEISVEDHLRHWARLDSLSKDQLKANVAELRERWKGRELVASELYGEVSKRRLASVAAAEEAERKRKSDARAARDGDRRRLFSTAFEK